MNTLFYNKFLYLFILSVLFNIAMCDDYEAFQTKIDSLKQLLHQTEEINRADIYNQIAEVETQYKTAEKEKEIFNLNQNLKSQKKIKLD